MDIKYVLVTIFVILLVLFFVFYFMYLSRNKRREKENKKFNKKIEESIVIEQEKNKILDRKLEEIDEKLKAFKKEGQYVIQDFNKSTYDYK
ncbi:MAG: hypothetical protein WCO35_00335 [Candidatus Nomurabacteria bacterium]